MNKKNTSFYLLSLLVIGFFAKFISLSNRIVLSRTIGIGAMSLFTLVNPLIVLLITFSSLSLPTVVATLIAKKPQESKKIFISAFTLIMSIAIILMILIFFLSEFIASNMLHNKQSVEAIKACCLLIPLVSLSSIIKGYFLGNSEVRLTSFSQIFEEGSRLIFIVVFSSFFMMQSDDKKAAFAVYSLCVGEIFQTTYLLLFAEEKFINRYKKLFIDSFHRENFAYKEIFSLSLPLTMSRAVGSLTYFLEPIILMQMLLKSGLSSDEITLNYGILSGYVMPLLLLPGFFSLALSNYLLPNMAKAIGNHNIKKARNIFFKITGSCLLIGTLISLVYFIFPREIMSLIYHTEVGSDLVRVLAFPFVIYYIETPISNALHAFNLSKKAFKATLFSSILRITILILFTTHFEVFTIAIATLASCYLDVLLNFIDVLRAFKRYDVKTIL